MAKPFFDSGDPAEHMSLIPVTKSLPSSMSKGDQRIWSGIKEVCILKRLLGLSDESLVLEWLGALA